MYEKVDFVICWVDGNDSNWLEEKKKFKPEVRNGNGEIRYRDWDILQYWFRGVEQYAPWVNKIHFVTWGHTPSWLNKDHPKINIVKHEDYIPNEYLPTFSARPIETNLHRIEGLSEQFVYFNDDMFLLKPVKKSDFFKGGYPRDIMAFDVGNMEDMAHGGAEFNSTVLINKYFNKREFIRSNFIKIFNLRYGLKMVRTILLLPWKSFTGFYNPHLPNSYLKSTFEHLWNEERVHLELTSSHQFRSSLDLTQNIFRHWQLASGNFIPRKSLGKLYTLGENHEEAQKVIEDQKDKMICLNDGDNIKDFEALKDSMKESFEMVLPNKSEFEK